MPPHTTQHLDPLPYQRNADLPKNVKNNLPKGAQDIYRKAFNSASDQYDEEERAHKVAWSTVKKEYKKENGDWKKKDCTRHASKARKCPSDSSPSPEDRMKKILLLNDGTP